MSSGKTNKSPRPVTIKDIARMLNVSVATVSRALRNTHDVSSDTQKKIFALANELHYRPNLNATGLVKGTSNTIGIVLPYINNYYFSTVITGIQEIAYRHKYNIILFLTDDSPEKELSVIGDLMNTGVDGLLVSVCSPPGSCQHYQQLIDHGIPIVFFDRVPGNIEASKVMQDDYNGAFKAVEHLIKSGYTKIAHIAGPKELHFTQQRLLGYSGALKKYGFDIQPDWIIYSGFSQKDGEEDAAKLLQCKKTPDAIFAANDRKALGAMIALKKNNVAIGKDIGVIGFTNDPASEIISPTLSTVAEPALEIGKTSCTLLIKHLRKKHTVIEETILPCELIIRESTRR
ncbi:MAG: LacI family DNA-binding transcriptional regulator [Chitinophagaceae bacterium]|nr:LacI family DNA-binding transcriptional regulator [Chitinophagaceae bacterium]